MPIDQSLPDEAPYGKADWTDYEDNWRDADATWLQDHGILRFTTTASRDTALPSAGPGQVIFNAEAGYLQLKSPSQWVDYKPLPLFMTKGEDSASQVLLSHVNAAGKGVSFSGTGPGYEVHVNTDMRVQNGVMVVDTTGVAIKIGAKTAKLITDATALVSDSPIKAPGLVSDGVITAVGAVTAGSFTAPAATITNINMSGTLTGGILNGSRALIGSVNIGWDPTRSIAVPTEIYGGAFVPNGGYVYGDGNSVLIRQRTPATGALGGAYVQVNATDTHFQGSGSVYMNPYLRIMGGRGIPWHNAGGTHVAWISPVIYSGSDPGAGNYPDGTLWIS